MRSGNNNSSMLSGSMETIQSSYEDSGILLQQEHENFGLMGDAAVTNGHDTTAVGEDFEQIDHPHEGLVYDNAAGQDPTTPHSISCNVSFEDRSDKEDELTSTGILICGPSRVIHFPRGTSASTTVPPDQKQPHNSISPHLSLPDSEYLPTDLQSLHLDDGSIHFEPEGAGAEGAGTLLKSLQAGHHLPLSDDEVKASRNIQQRVHYFLVGGLVLLAFVFMGSTFWLWTERSSWQLVNQKLEDRMSRMHSDLADLTKKWEMDQEASIASSQTMTASLQAKVAEQERKIERIAQEQRESVAQKRTQGEQLKKEEEIRRLEEMRQREAAKKQPPFANKKASGGTSNNSSSDSFSAAASKRFDQLLTETEHVLLKFSDETQDRIRFALSSLTSKVSSFKDSFFAKAESTYQYAKARIAQAWLDFTTAVHEPKEGWVEKAAPIVSSLFYVTAATALTEGAMRSFFKYMQDDDCTPDTQRTSGV